MVRRGWNFALGVLLVALTAVGCGSQESGTPPVAASIAGGSDTPSAASDAPSASTPAPTRPQRDPLHPVVEIETSHGALTVELDAEKSPGTVSNFLNYAHAGFYEQTVFHYVAPGTMIIAGGYTADLQPKETSLPIRNEAHNGLKNTRGTIAMTRPLTAIDSATSQFFINLGDNPALDFQDDTAEGYGYCVFGRVIDGMDIADQIGSEPTHDQAAFVSTPREPIVIQSVHQVR